MVTFTLYIQSVSLKSFHIRERNQEEGIGKDKIDRKGILSFMLNGQMRTLSNNKKLGGGQKKHTAVNK